MYVDAHDQLLGNWNEITVSVWEQRQYDTPLVGRQASQGRERQLSEPRVVFEKPVVLDNYDGQMITREEFGLNFLTFVL